MGLLLDDEPLTATTDKGPGLFSVIFVAGTASFILTCSCLRDFESHT
jgi:hypothetical protein